MLLFVDLREREGRLGWVFDKTRKGLFCYVGEMGFEGCLWRREGEMIVLWGCGETENGGE